MIRTSGRYWLGFTFEAHDTQGRSCYDDNSDLNTVRCLGWAHPILLCMQRQGLVAYQNVSSVGKHLQHVLVCRAEPDQRVWNETNDTQLLLL